MAENNENDTGLIENTGSITNSNDADTATPQQVPELPARCDTDIDTPSSPLQVPELHTSSDALTNITATTPDGLALLATVESDVESLHAIPQHIQVQITNTEDRVVVTPRRQQRIITPEYRPDNTDTPYPYEEDEERYHTVRTPVSDHSGIERLLPLVLPPTAINELVATAPASYNPDNSTSGAAGEPRSVSQYSRIAVVEPRTVVGRRPQNARQADTPRRIRRLQLRLRRAILRRNAILRSHRLARDRRSLFAAIVRRHRVEAHTLQARLAEDLTEVDRNGGHLVPDEATPTGHIPSGSGGAGRWQCVRCDSLFDTAAQLSRHRTAVHFTIPGKAFSCFKCSKKLV